MFDKDFYPTPRGVIEQMLEGSIIEGKVILEPQAGKGNIVDYLKDFGAKEVIACERNLELQKILSFKCHIINDDFLSVTAECISHIDMIVMNPPFSNIEEHILHAWEIAPQGCEIVSLTDTNTISKHSTKKQRLISELIDSYGHSEYLGQCFNDSERTTDVSVSCFKLYKPKSGENEFEGYFDLSEEQQMQTNGIMQHNDVLELVNRYTGAVKAFDSIKEVSDNINSLMSPLGSCPINFGAFYTNKDGRGSNSHITREIFKKELQKAAWHNVFGKFKMDKYVTTDVKSDINKFVNKQSHIPFTVRNIFKMVEMIVGTHSSRMDTVLVQAFERICNLSKKNHTGGEGWRTNSDYMVNMKFISDYTCDYDARWPKDHVKLTIKGMDFMDDIVKGLCNLTGQDYDMVMSKEVKDSFGNITRSRTSLYYHFADSKVPWGEWTEWTFFRCKGFKKGTMHFEFIDPKVHELFNRRVAEIKGWALPEETKKAHQRDYKTNSTSTDITLF